MNALIVADRSIRMDAVGRYCLNDLHRAAGGEARHKPGNWVALDQTQGLVAAMEIAGIPAIEKRQGVGTFVARELVYAYAMWISPVFNLQVIRSFDVKVTGQQPADMTAALHDPATLRALLTNQVDARLRLEAEAEAHAPKVAAFERLAAQHGAVSMREAAKLLEIKQRQLIAWLCEHSWIYRATDYGSLQAYQRRIDEGLMSHRMVPVVHADGYERQHPQAMVTPKGLTRLAEQFEASANQLSQRTPPPTSH